MGNISLWGLVRVIKKIYSVRRLHTVCRDQESKPAKGDSKPNAHGRQTILVSFVYVGEGSYGIACSVRVPGELVPGCVLPFAPSPTRGNTPRGNTPSSSGSKLFHFSQACVLDLKQQRFHFIFNS
jgi:hypothetical protein